MKKTLAIVLALVMILSLATTAFAATVTNNTTGHSYNAYQVFSGTQADGSSALGEVVWGSGVNGDTLLTNLKANYDYFDTCTSAADVAAILEGKSDDCAEAKALADEAANCLTSTYTAIAADATSVDLAAGYWLLVDVTPGLAAGDAYNAALLQVTNDGDITIAVKYDAPEVEKTVDDAVAEIGQTVTFTLTATMPSNLEGYDTYKMVFTDTMSKGLTYGAITSVTVDGTALTDTQYTSSVVNGADNTTLTVTISDVLALGAEESDTVVVTYTATVNSDAVIGAEGNSNKVKLTYSNNPNATGDGETTEDEVKVYTAQFSVTKTDGTNPLEGAGFVLKNNEDKYYKWDDVNKVVTWVDSIDDADVHTSDASGVVPAFTGLDDGDYTLVEKVVPAGYNKADDKTFTISNTDYTDANLKQATTVINQSGSTLPETGGIGTTLFYVFGGIFAVGAAVLLVTKKRMSVAE